MKEQKYNSKQITEYFYQFSVQPPQLSARPLHKFEPN